MSQKGLPPQLSSSPDPKKPIRKPCSIAEEQPCSSGAALCGGWAVKHAQGRAKAQEDAYAVHELGPSAVLPQGLLLGVWDGHGGDEVSQHAAARLHDHFLNSLASAAARGTGDFDDSGPDSADCMLLEHYNASTLQSPPPSPLTPIAPPLPLPEPDCLPVPAAALDGADTSPALALVSEALRASFRMTDQDLAGTETGEFVGSTGLVVVLGHTHLWVAHCGDSRAALQRGGSAIALTSDHKPTREDEETRIRSLGGRIVYTHGAPRVMGMLAMTRSIGDHYLRPYIIADPEVACVERSEDDEVLILATDGLWDVFTCTEATSMASRCIQRSRERGMSRHGACQVAASVLTQAAMDRGSRDNVTVIVVSLSARDAHDDEVELRGAGGRPLRHALALKCNSGTCSPGYLGASLMRQAASHDDLTKLQDEAQGPEQQSGGSPLKMSAATCTASAAAAALGAVLSLGESLQRGGGGGLRPPRHFAARRALCAARGGSGLSHAVCGAAELLRRADAGLEDTEEEDELEVEGVRVEVQVHGPAPAAAFSPPRLVHADTLVRRPPPDEPSSPLFAMPSFAGNIADAAAEWAASVDLAAAAAQGQRRPLSDTDPFAAAIGSLEDTSDEDSAADAMAGPSGDDESKDEADEADSDDLAAQAPAKVLLGCGRGGGPEVWSGGLPLLRPRLAGGEADAAGIPGQAAWAGCPPSAASGAAVAATADKAAHQHAPAVACSAPASAPTPGPTSLRQPLSRALAAACNPRGSAEDGEAALQRASWLSVEVPGLASAVAVLKFGGAPGAATSGPEADEWEWSRASVP